MDSFSDFTEYGMSTFDEDCELVDICEKLGATYHICYKGSELVSGRCNPAQKQSILHGQEMKQLQLEIQDHEDKRQQLEMEIQRLRDQKAVRRSWVQLVLAAILGGIFTKLVDYLPQFIDWLRALLDS